MRLVIDANILVGELLRTRGKELIADPRLELLVAFKAWEEAQHELSRRVGIITERSQLSQETAEELLGAALNLAEHKVTVIETEKYNAYKAEALARVPDDPDDWHTVALALTVDAAILTKDKDFLGCGVPTWTTETLRAKLKL